MLPIIAVPALIASIAEIAQVVMVILIAVASIMAAVNSLKQDGVNFDSVSNVKSNVLNLGMIKPV